MKQSLGPLMLLTVLVCGPLGATETSMGPLKVSPLNGRYFVTPSGEAPFLTGSHTWAALQERGIEGETPDFDYPRYLDFMEAHEHNFLRLWIWEHAQWMQFVKKEVPVRYAPPIYRRTGPGLALDGKPKFDVTQFNPEFFDRLRTRVEMARERGIYVSVMLFQGFSLDKRRGMNDMGNAFMGHPFNKANNVNSIDGDPSGSGSGFETHELKVPEVTHLQEALVRKIIDTVNDLDNVLYEISNESHADSVEWQYHMIRFVKEYEAAKPFQHPVGMTGAPIETDALLASPADWISPKGEQYMKDPIDHGGKKVVLVDTDHCAPMKPYPESPWLNLLRGNHYLLMDSYMDYRLGSPAAPVPDYEKSRLAMGQARRMAAQLDLAAMTPQSGLSSTGYCLAGDGIWLVYKPEKQKRMVTLVIEELGQNYFCQLFDPFSGDKLEARSVRSTQDGFVVETPSDAACVLLVGRVNIN